MLLTWETSPVICTGFTLKEMINSLSWTSLFQWHTTPSVHAVEVNTDSHGLYSYFVNLLPPFSIFNHLKIVVYCTVVENLEHCDFIALRNMLIRTHLQDLKDVTNSVHYENYRCRKLAGLGSDGKPTRISNT
jgi:hypothetical protein